MAYYGGYDIDDKFFLDPSNFQGHRHSQYKNILMSKAITTTSEYYDLQTKVVDLLNVKISKTIYQQEFLLLNKGTLPDGSQRTTGGIKIKSSFSFTICSRVLYWCSKCNC